MQDRDGVWACPKQKRGRKKKLSSSQVKALETALLQNPFLTNVELARHLHGRISPSTAGRVIRQSAHNFVVGDIKYDDPDTFTVEHLHEAQAFLKKARHIPYKDWIYIDETFVSKALAPRKGRFPSGYPPHLPKPRYARRLTVWSILGYGGLICPSVILDRNAPTTEEFEEFVQEDLCPHLKPVGDSKHPASFVTRVITI